MPLSNPILILSDDLAQQLPRRVTERRKAAGLTQAAVAQRLGITEGRYGHYERGFRRFPVAILPKLAEALGCSEAQLIGTSEVQPKKRGPTSRAEQLTKRLGRLPRAKQAMILDMIEGAIEKAS